jgi:hypothetical protein
MAECSALSPAPRKGQPVCKSHAHPCACALSGAVRLAASNGSEILSVAKPRPDGFGVKALARTSRWQKLLDAGLTAR